MTSASDSRDCSKPGGWSSSSIDHTAALPTVTPTAKPAISPVASKIAGLTAGEDFRPSVAQDQKDLTVDRFRKLLDEIGFQILSGGETGEPGGRGWTESGNLDQSGHAEGLNLARRIREHLSGFVERITDLLEAGWQEVRVVTDHGWLLGPGRAAEGRAPQVSDGDPLGSVCGREAFGGGGLSELCLVLVGGRAGRVPVWHRLLCRGKGI